MSLDCWCRPRIDWDDIVIHNALDQRERSVKRGDYDA